MNDKQANFRRYAVIKVSNMQTHYHESCTFTTFKDVVPFLQSHSMHGVSLKMLTSESVAKIREIESHKSFHRDIW